MLPVLFRQFFASGGQEAAEQYEEFVQLRREAWRDVTRPWRPVVRLVRSRRRSGRRHDERCRGTAAGAVRDDRAHDHDVQRGACAVLAEHGWEVHAAAAPGPLLDEFQAQTGARVHHLPMTRQMRPAHDARALTAAHSLMRRVRPHVVHAQSPKGALIGLAAARRPECPRASTACSACPPTPRRARRSGCCRRRTRPRAGWRIACCA
jgi:hypothetical protein